MKRIWLSLCLAAGLAAPSWGAVKVIVSGGVLRDAAGVALPPDSIVALVASTQDNVFKSPNPMTPFSAGTLFGGDDVVLAVFPVDSLYSAVNGGFVGVASIDYTALGIANLAANDRLALYWFPATSLSGGQILPNSAYGSYRTDAVINRSTTGWVAPDDASGGTIELNFLTQAVGGEVDNALAVATLVVGADDGVVTVAATDASAGESLSGLGTGTFTFSRTGSTAAGLTVNFTTGGTAVSGTDYTAIGTTVNFLAGSATATATVTVLDDLLTEGPETVFLTLTAGTGYTVGTPASATITIQDDDDTHTADTDHNLRINLVELTRVIELFNTRFGTTRTGCYKIDPLTEDGFAPDPSRAASEVVTLPFYHSSDFSLPNPRDAKINLIELTRIIELYNYRAGTTRTGQYHIQAGTEDGFAPGP